MKIGTVAAAIYLCYSYHDPFNQLLADLVNEPENDIKKEITEKEPDTDGDNSELPDGFIQFRDEDV